MTKNCYMVSLDLRGAFYSVPIHADHQKFLKFKWKGELFKFTCLPNGLACAPRLFTKLLKPVISHLRQLGHISSPYLDDSFLLADTREECLQNVRDTVALFKKLGFVIHDTKSQTIPTRCIEHLGFVFDSVHMTVTVNTEKIEKLRSYAEGH